MRRAILISTARWISDDLVTLAQRYGTTLAALPAPPVEAPVADAPAPAPSAQVADAPEIPPAQSGSVSAPSEEAPAKPAAVLPNPVVVPAVQTGKKLTIVKTVTTGSEQTGGACPGTSGKPDR